MNGRTNRYLQAVSGKKSGAIVGGSWDRRVPREDFTGKMVYRSCVQHWQLGNPWEETEIVQLYVDRLENGIPCRFTSKEELLQRYHELDRIYEQIVTDGRLSTDRASLMKVSFLRDGTLAWGPDGRHRICMALVAGHKRMPARVGFVHPQAIELLERAKSP